MITRQRAKDAAGQEETSSPRPGESDSASNQLGRMRLPGLHRLDYDQDRAADMSCPEVVADRLRDPV